MRNALEQIVNAVLYESYMLYPYRAPSKKNQRERFTLGRVYPRSFSAKENGAEVCIMQTECLFRTTYDQARLKISFGFLQPVIRNVGLIENEPGRNGETEKAQFQELPQFEVAGNVFQPWMDSVERKVSIGVGDFSEDANIAFTFPPAEDRADIRNEHGQIAGVAVRRQEFLEGRIEASFTQLQKDLFRVCVRVINLSEVEPMNLGVRQNVLLRTFASSHFMLELENGQFLSLLETPPEFKTYAEECKNIGCWPVLVGDKAAGDRTKMLASPILLYDHPEIATESAEECFEGTEIDEILALRVLTMSDDEKRELQIEAFSRQILERTGALTAGEFLKLHGVTREPRVVSEEFFNPGNPARTVTATGIELKHGDRVVIRPKHPADALDLILSGKIAIIEAIEQDVKGQIHVAVVLEKDPGQDVGIARQHGHRFFFGADEVEPVRMEAAA